MNETDLAYLAGVMDSDGWFTIKHHATNSTYTSSYTFSEHAGCAQVSPEAVDQLKELFGGRIYLRSRKGKDHWKPLYYWVVSNRLAADMTRILRPYLRIKAAQADLVLTIRASKDRPRTETCNVATGLRGGKGMDPLVISERRLAYEQIRSLNDRREGNQVFSHDGT